MTSFLLCIYNLSTSTLPPIPNLTPPLSPPYIVSVPASAALTATSLTLKNQLWPTMYRPKHKDEDEIWTRAKVAWAWDVVERLVREARKGKERGEVSLVPNEHLVFLK